MGSGSTMIACQNTNRNGIGIEKDKNYFEIEVKRIEENKYKLF
jgi:DNA modification methylase